jgi:hypothetical protein
VPSVFRFRPRLLVYPTLVGAVLLAWALTDRHLISRGYGEHPTPHQIEAAEAREAGERRSLEDWVRDLGGSDRIRRRRAMAALAGRGRSVVPALLGALEDEDAAPWAALTLGRIGPDADAAVPVLKEIVEETGAMWAVHALGGIGVSREEHSALLGISRRGRKGILEGAPSGPPGAPAP